MNEYLVTLKRFSKLLTKQEYKTLKGQILHGDIDGAEKGLLRIINKYAVTEE